MGKIIFSPSKLDVIMSFFQKSKEKNSMIVQKNCIMQ